MQTVEFGVGPRVGLGPEVLPATEVGVQGARRQAVELLEEVGETTFLGAVADMGVVMGDLGDGGIDLDFRDLGLRHAECVEEDVIDEGARPKEGGAVLGAPGSHVVGARLETAGVSHAWDVANNDPTECVRG